MDVHFISKQKGNTVVQCPELGPKYVIRFFRGKKTTSNKTEIKRLLSDDYARRNCRLAPGQDLEAISEYLDSPDRPDTFTKEYLDSIPFDAWKEILEKTDMVRVKFPLVGVAKSELQGRPIDPVIEEIVNRWNDNSEVEEPEEVNVADAEPEIEEPTDQEPEEKKEPVKVKLPTKKSEAPASSDLSVQAAFKYLSGKDYEEVKDFMAEDEDRVSLIKHWNTKFPEHEIDY